MPSTSAEVFTTRELALAATLLSHGHENISLDIQYEGRRNLPVGYFGFAPSEKLAKDVDHYWKRDKEGYVDPQTYHAALRSLKSRVTDAVNK